MLSDPFSRPNLTLQKFRRLGSTGRCLEDVTVKIFMGADEMPPGEVRGLSFMCKEEAGTVHTELWLSDTC